MASRLIVFLEAFGKHSRGKKHVAWALCALLGLTLASELGKAQSNTTHPPVISTSTQWTLDAPMLVSSSATGVPSNGFSMQGAFSPDGAHLLFWSRSTNLAPGATSILFQLYLKDLTTGAVSVVSTDVNGIEGNNDSSPPSNSSQILMFSPDGTKVVFESASTNLVAGANGHQQIFIKDLTTNVVNLVSVDANGNQGNANSMNFTFSPDGTQVAFDSASTNLISAGATGNQVFVKNLTTGAVTLVSTDSNGVPGNGASSRPYFRGMALKLRSPLPPPTSRLVQRILILRFSSRICSPAPSPLRQPTPTETKPITTASFRCSLPTARNWPSIPFPPILFRTFPASTLRFISRTWH